MIAVPGNRRVSHPVGAFPTRWVRHTDNDATVCPSYTAKPTVGRAYVSMGAVR